MLESLGKSLGDLSRSSLGRVWAAQILEKKISKQTQLELKVSIRGSQVRLLCENQATIVAANLAMRKIWHLIKQTPQLGEIKSVKVKLESRQGPTLSETSEP